MDDTAQRLVDGFQLLVRRFALAERTDAGCCGLTVPQAATLEALRAAGPVRLSGLGRRLGITPSTLTRNLDRLIEAGLVARRADPDDARAGRVVLTPAGRKAAEGMDRRAEAFARSVLERLPESRRARVLEALSDLLVAVREATEDCCPGAFDHLMGDLSASGSGSDAKRGVRNECACD